MQLIYKQCSNNWKEKKRQSPAKKTPLLEFVFELQFLGSIIPNTSGFYNSSCNINYKAKK